MVRTDEKLDRSFREGDGWNAHTAETFSVTSTDEDGKKRVQSLSGHERNKLFINQNAERFHDVSALSGLDSIADGRAFALFDYDKDGWQDVVLANANAPTFELFRNELKQRVSNNHRIAFRLIGGNQSATPSSEWSNRDAWGAVVTVSTGGQQFLRELRCGEGLGAENSRTLLIGLGEHDVVDSVDIAWPSGKKQALTGLDTEMVHTINELGGHQSEPFEIPAASTPLTSVARNAGARLNVAGVSNEKPMVHITTATWCPACKKSLPQVAFLKERLLENFSFYGLPTDTSDELDDLEKYDQEFQPAYELLTQLNSRDRAATSIIIQDFLGSEVLPATILTNQTGEVLAVFAGVPSISELLKASSVKNGGEK